jgi:hypothetical protein
MPSEMNSRCITDYILKLEKDNSELKEFNSRLDSVTDTLEKTRSQLTKFMDLQKESRIKIDQLKRLLTEAYQEKTDALEKLRKVSKDTNPSLYHTTTNPMKKSELNAKIAGFLRDLGETYTDVYRAAAYKRGAEIVKNLDEDIISGQSIIHMNGIGPSIAGKIDQFLEVYYDEENDDDYKPETDDEVETDDENDSTISSYDTNMKIADELRQLAFLEKLVGTKNKYKIFAYNNAADIIDDLSFEVTNGTELLEFNGIGKGITEKVDEILQFGSTRRAHQLKEENPDYCI